ncbi:random slug protein 5-like isoform X1 [Prunus yedoensis var. nudiflora]|uniref:Random slug protein 5-like isoform X1 n=1 Tax=Prunus yedoensis var. nudiflora TaxID=2094558 RepID=A0A314V011_PRUYE|nr:random slug protein 5-like isoform X1 [Prunus yedoensis var. nudiflora]
MSFKKREGTIEKALTPEEQLLKIYEVRHMIGPIADKLPAICSEESIARYLRARNWNTKKAGKMLKETIKWRMEYKPEKIRWENIAPEAETGKIYRANYFDKCGRAILIMRPGFQNTNAVNGQIIISLKVTRETAKVLQNHYPERLGLGILYNPPKIFESFWTMVKPFLEPKTYKKMKFVYSDNPQSQKIMEDLFHMDKLESAFGGKNSCGFDYQAYAQRMREDDKKMSSFIDSGCSPSVISELQQSDALASGHCSEISDEGGCSSCDEAASSNLDVVDEKIQGQPLDSKDVANGNTTLPKEMQMSEPA